MRRRVWVAVGATITSLVVGGGAFTSAAHADGGGIVVNESFDSGSLGANWTLPAAPAGNANAACLVPGDGQPGGGPVPQCGDDSAGQAGLQLNDDNTGGLGALNYGTSVPSAQGLDASFTTYQFSTNEEAQEGDGISFFLAASDPTSTTASPITLGPAGGSLGYSPSDSLGSQTLQSPGLTDGYLAVGLDRANNFSNPGFSGTTCGDSQPGESEGDAIDIRGPGSGTTGYCLLNTISSYGDGSGGALGDFGDPNGVPVEVLINPSSVATNNNNDTVLVPSHSYVVIIRGINSQKQTELTGSLPSASGILPASWLDANGVPKRLTFGWAGSTGSYIDAHVISDAAVSAINRGPRSVSR